MDYVIHEKNEGGGERKLRDAKLLILYFRSKARGMKYTFELIHFLTCVKVL